MVEVFDKRLFYVVNDVDMWELALIFDRWLKYVGNDFDISEIF